MSLVTIIGAGPAGATLALLLARASVPVTLIDGAAESEGWRLGEGLPPSARLVLQRLGFWERFAADGHLPSYGNRSAWASNQVETSDFLYNRLGHGYHLDRTRFDRMLLDAAQEAGARFERARGTAVARTEAGWRLQTTGGTLESAFIADATGRSAWLARQIGIPRLTHDRLIGVAALMAPAGEPDPDSLTMIEAVEEGWWYSAGVPDGRRVVAFMTDGDLPAAEAARDAEQWHRALSATHHLSRRMEAWGYRRVSPLQAANATSSRLEQVVGARWIAVGDAAAAYDPLSSQGILMALATAIEAAEAITSGEPGRYAAFIESVWRQYLHERAAYYGLEQRWESPFWRRRRQPEAS